MNKDLTLRKQNINEYFMKPSCKKYLQESLPKVGITSDRMVRLLFSAITKTPKLADCSPKSLFNIMVQCAIVGLEPNTALGHAYIIPFGNEATLIIGYRGMIELCQRSGKFQSIMACEVYPDDYFQISRGTDAFIKHIPSYNYEYDEQEILGCYAVAKDKDGSVVFEYMPKYQIDKIRARSKTSKNGPWVTDYAMMARKTVIRKLMHYLPLTIEMAEAVKVDSENEAGIESAAIIDDAMDLNEKLKADSKKEEKKKAYPKSDKKKPDVKKDPRPDMNKSPVSELINIVKSFEIRGIFENEICDYFGVDDLAEMDSPAGIADLKSVITTIEAGGKEEAMAFKKKAAERKEMRCEGRD